MSQRFRRGVISIVLAPWLVASATPAVEHVHKSEGERPRAIAHRHLQPHALPAPDHDRADLDRDEGRIVWLGCVGARQATREFPGPCFACVTHVELAPALVSQIAAPVSDTAPPHGPPRLAQSLRAPPVSVL